MKISSMLRHPIFVSAIAAVVVCVAVASMTSAGLLDSIELQGYDLLIHAQGFAPPSQDLMIVDFDDASVDELNAFPIPRALLASVIEKLNAGGAELIGMDILLDKKKDPADDQRLASAIAAAGNVILAKNFETYKLPPSDPLPEFRRAAFDVAFINLPEDDDGFFRRVFLGVPTPGFSGISFPVALATNYLKKPLVRDSRETFRLGANEIFLDGSGLNTALIGLWSPKPARVVPVQRLLAEDFDPKIFKGKIVLVGSSSAAAKDFYATPVFRFEQPSGGRAMLSGTEVHAAAIASLLNGKTIRLLNKGSLWALNLVFIWLFIALIITLRPAFSIPAVLAGALGVYLLALTLYSHHQMWMRFVSTEAGIVLALPAGLGYRFIEERRLKSQAQIERREIMGLFERYVSPEVAAEIWQRRNEIVLAGQEKTATVLFSDIRNFTALTAGKPSAQVLAWLNDYFTAMSEVIQENGGYLNKFIGDGMLVVFGVPLSNGEEMDACSGVRTALQMVERVEKFNAQQDGERPRLAIGVGLHTGLLTAGNVGARDRLEYSVIGETVNLASRLESLTKEFNTAIIMSPATHERVQSHFETTLAGDATVRGFAGKIMVYTAIREIVSEVKP